MGFLLSIGGCQVSDEILRKDHATDKAKVLKLIGLTRACPFLWILVAPLRGSCIHVSQWQAPYSSHHTAHKPV
jgi:hypothetical protein